MIDTLFNTVSAAFDQGQQALFEVVVQPLLFRLGMGNLLEDGFVATGWLLVGLFQLAVIVVVFGTLQRWRPVEAISQPAAVRVDILYTLIHRLGLFRIALFFSVDPLWDGLFGQLAVAGWSGWHLDAAVAPWWPGVSDTPWFAFAVYLVVFDFVDYWLHRGQHHFNWWWSLHAVHHSQQQMTMWSDNRNHLLDDLIRDTVFVVVARLIGVAPAQFIALVALSQLIESLSHANVRLGFGRWCSRLLVSPRFHRLHHSIGLGHESAGRGSLGGHNFAVLFPVWDLVFGTADFSHRYDPTGIRDQLAEEGGRDYGRGFWSQQWRALLRMAGRDRARGSALSVRGPAAADRALSP